MRKYEEAYDTIVKFTKPMSEAKTVPKWEKQKIPVDIRQEWYEDTIVAAIAEYNLRCLKWLQTHGV